MSNSKIGNITYKVIDMAGLFDGTYLLNVIMLIVNSNIYKIDYPISINLILK